MGQKWLGTSELMSTHMSHSDAPRLRHLISENREHLHKSFHTRAIAIVYDDIFIAV